MTARQNCRERSEPLRGIRFDSGPAARETCQDMKLQSAATNHQTFSQDDHQAPLYNHLFSGKTAVLPSIIPIILKLKKESGTIILLISNLGVQ